MFRDDRVASALNHCDTNVLHDANQGQNRAFWRPDLCMEIPETGIRGLNMSCLFRNRKRPHNNSERQLEESNKKRMQRFEISDYGPGGKESIMHKRKSPRLLDLSSSENGSLKHPDSIPTEKQESSAIKRRRRYLAVKVAPPVSLANSSCISSEKIVFTNSIRNFINIQENKVQLVVWRRSSLPTFMTSLADPHLPAYILPAVKCTVVPDELAPILKRKTVKLAKSIGQDKANEMIRDICMLAKEFAAATKIHKVAVKLEHFGDNGCQYWHQDSVPYRLVATYRGPCTEWVHPDHGDATLRRRQDNSRHKQTFAHNDVPLFKGRGHSESRDSTLLKHPGIVHRSPRILGSRIHRLVLVLDVPENCC